MHLTLTACHSFDYDVGAAPIAALLSTLPQRICHVSIMMHLMQLDLVLSAVRSERLQLAKMFA